MAANEAVCKDKSTALAILEMLVKTARGKTQQAAIQAVTTWIERSHFEDCTKLTPEERQARIRELEIKMRNGMSAEERREMAAFYLEGLEGADSDHPPEEPPDPLTEPTSIETLPLMQVLENQTEQAEPVQIVSYRGIGVRRTDSVSVPVL